MHCFLAWYRKCKVFFTKCAVFVVTERVIWQKLYRTAESAGIKISLDALHLLYRVIEGGDDGNTDNDIRTALAQLREVFKDFFVWHARVFPMLLTVEALDVIEEKVGVGKDTLEVGEGNIACRIDGGVKCLRLARAQQLLESIDLQHTFAAGEGDTATGAFIKRLVLTKLCQKLLYGVLLAADFSGILWAIEGALAAQLARGERIRTFFAALAASRALVTV